METPNLIVEQPIKKLVKAANQLYNGNLKLVKAHFSKNPIKQNGQIVEKVQVYETVEGFANRVTLNDQIKRKHIDAITDTGTQKILNRHLLQYTDENGKEDFEAAFGIAGLKELNDNITTLNDGMFHQSIKKIRIYEEGSKFPIGQECNKGTKYVEAAKGTNLFFAIYWNEDKQKRIYETKPLHTVIAHQKQEAESGIKDFSPVPIDSSKGKFLFSLSPNDLVYVPTDEEKENPQLIDIADISKNTDRIYKMVSSSGHQCFFIQHDVAKAIKDKFEFSALNKMEKTLDNKMVKESCWKLKVNRIGHITQVIKPY